MWKRIAWDASKAGKFFFPVILTACSTISISLRRRGMSDSLPAWPVIPRPLSLLSPMAGQNPFPGALCQPMAAKMANVGAGTAWGMRISRK